MVASLTSQAARPTMSTYTAAKVGARQLVRALVIERAPFDIRVNGIGPAHVQTDTTPPLRE